MSRGELSRFSGLWALVAACHAPSPELPAGRSPTSEQSINTARASNSPSGASSASPLATPALPAELYASFVPDVPLLRPAVGAELAPPETAAAQLAWARERYPEAMRFVHAGSLVPRLLQWLDGAEAGRAYISDSRWGTCRHIVLSKAPSVQDEGPGLSAKVYFLGGSVTAHADGTRVLEQHIRFESVFLGHALLANSHGAFAELDAGGRWQEGGMWARSDGGAELGVLSEVTSERIRYGASAISARFECQGPPETLSCPNGGSKRCASCSQLAINVRRLSADERMGLGAISTPVYPPGCSDLCPRVPTPELERLFEAFEAQHFYFDDRAVRYPAIYRTLEACETDRP